MRSRQAWEAAVIAMSAIIAMTAIMVIIATPALSAIIAECRAREPFAGAHDDAFFERVMPILLSKDLELRRAFAASSKHASPHLRSFLGVLAVREMA